MDTATDTLNKNAAIKRTVTDVEWKDLRALTKGQIIYNLILPYPFLLLSWWFAWQSMYVFACICTYLFFAAAFRQAHDGYHHSLGVGKQATTALLMLLSVLLFTGLHSIRATHMQHHRDPLGENDIEGSLAKLSWWQALIGGVRYRFTIYKQGMRLSSKRNQKKAWFEFSLIALAIATILIGSLYYVLTYKSLSNSSIAIYTPIIQIAVYHLIVMSLANSCVGLIAVWGVHHDVEDNIARTERNRLVNLLTFGLLFHVEHHLFPAVPTNNLPKLAERLDAVAPHLSEHRVTPTKVKVINVLKASWKTQDRRSIHGKIDKQYDNNNCPIRSFIA